MFFYSDSIKDKKLKHCTPDKFRELTEAERTAMLINAYRSGENPDAKSQLPAFVFMGCPPAELVGKIGSRKKTELKPTGLVMFDFDHVSKAKVNGEECGLTPYDVYDRFLKLMPKLGLTLEHDLALAHITPSGDGLRTVIRVRKNKSVAEIQEQVGKLLGIECDKAVKDLSRLSFCPMAEDILFMNQFLLFATPDDLKREALIDKTIAQTNDLINKLKPLANNENSTQETTPTTAPKAQEATTERLELHATDSAEKVEEQGEDDMAGVGHPDKVETLAETETNTPTADTLSTGKPQCYRGIPYQDIIKKWVELRGGTPEPGDRHATLIALAMDLRKICDNDKEWLAELMPDFGKGEEEKRDAIDWAVSQKPTLVNGTLKDVLKFYGIEKNSEPQNSSNSSNSLTENPESAESLPPAMPDELPGLIKLLTQNVMPHQRAAVATMVFPALSVYTNDAAFKLADNDTYELSMMAVLVGKQSVGKGCIDKPIDRILKRIEQQDKINRFRESEWKDRDRRRKSNERGEKKPALPIRILNSDTTNAAFLMRLVAAEEGDGERNNLTTFTLVSEIESLYKFCSTGGSMNVAQTIKYAWDRKLTGADRVTSNAVCARTPLRWNFCASTTVGGAKKFFQKVLTDGVTSRIDFCTIIPPSGPFQFRYGDYTKEFNEQLKPYIDNLENFRCEHDEEGKVIPVVFDRMIDIERQLDQYIEEVGGVEPDDTYEDYAYRAKVMAIKKLIILYIANGCKWEEAFEPFVWWTFKYGMWCKMNLFYDAAAEAFKDEQINGTHGGNKSPLKEMRRTFTYPEFVAKCQEQRVKQSPRAILRKYKQRGMIVETDGKYMINPEFATKWNIPG